MFPEKILEYLETNCQGRENATTGELIAKSLGIDKRTVQKTIEQLRRDGHPILSADQGRRGYFYPVSFEEGAECFRQMESRAKGIFETNRNIKRALTSKFCKPVQIGLEFKDIA